MAGVGDVFRERWRAGMPSQQHWYGLNAAIETSSFSLTEADTPNRPRFYYSETATGKVYRPVATRTVRNGDSVIFSWLINVEAPTAGRAGGQAITKPMRIANGTPRPIASGSCPSVVYGERNSTGEEQKRRCGDQS